MTESLLSKTASLAGDPPFYVWLRRLVNVEPIEVKALLWSFVYFFSLLCRIALGQSYSRYLLQHIPVDHTR
jgi:hypothetical protein